MPDYKVLDTTKTSPEWQSDGTLICVLPVGSFEQHSRHLPLGTDNFEAEYFARFIASEIGAALLPVLNYATSLEQTGFKGTVTLRPETLMQIVRDIAGEVEGQGFDTMILLNAHGGNYCLGPVVRDINRRNGKLKVLHVNFWTFADRSVLEAAAQGKPDIHASEFETSIMLALKPDWVRPERANINGPIEKWKQPDLNTFGVGYFAPDGALGYPSLASREKGEQLVASIKRNMIPHIRERLSWLATNRTYSGKGLNER